MRYFFNVTDGHGVTIDMDGTELDQSQTAMDEAVKDVRLLLADGDVRGFCRRHWRLDVVNEAGGLVFSLPFGHALQADMLPSVAKRAAA